MGQSMKANGEIIKQMDMGSSGMQMVMFMKENGKMIRPTVMEFTFM